MAAHSKQSILVITGMHRSGTSLMASLLQSAGMDVGATLVGPAKGNLKGHFENVDFMELHRSILQSQGYDPSGWLTQGNLEITEPQVQAARTIVAKNAVSDKLWGWKDPRTTLFLEFWAGLLPTANFLLLFRAPWEVADSLFRRGLTEDAVFEAHPDFAIKVWLHYNYNLLDFWQRFPDRCLLASIDRITQQPERVFDQLQQKFAIALAAPQTEIYDRGLLKTEATMQHYPTLVQHYFPNAIDLYQTLLRQEAECYHTQPDLAWLETIQLAKSSTAWAFQDWRSARQVEGESRQAMLLKDELTQTQQQLAQAQQNLEETGAQLTDALNRLTAAHASLEARGVALAETQAQLSETQAQWAATQAKLTETHTQWAATQTKLATTQTHLQKVEQQAYTTNLALEAANARIGAMETSKFWRIRKVWFQLRRAIGIGGQE